jgi:hypothetical protein
MTMTGTDDTVFTACAYCGASFQSNVEYPVVTTQKDGELKLYSFCDEECRTAWELDN